MTKKTPRLEIDLAKIAHNVRTLVGDYGVRGIKSFIGVTKGVCGDPLIARVFRKNGISILADSRVENFQRMEDAGIRGPFLLLRLPALSEVEEEDDIEASLPADGSSVESSVITSDGEESTQGFPGGSMG